MTSKPLVSIIMPAYNAMDFIAESIESVLNQEYDHWELIIIDDSSEDETLNIARKYQDSDLRIKILTLTKNSGRPAVCRNHGMRQANGDFIAFLDADDLWHPEKLVEQVEFFQKNPGMALVFGKFRVISDDPRFNGKEIMPSGNIDWNQSVYDRLLKYDFIANSSVMINRSRLSEKNRFFDEDIKLAFVEDWDLWLRITKSGLVGYIPRSLGVYRMHGTNFSLGFERLNRALAVIEKHQVNGFIERSAARRAKANVIFTVAWSSVEQNPARAKTLFSQGMKLSGRFSKIYWMNMIGRILTFSPKFSGWMKRNSIDRKIGKIFLNHQDL